MRLLILCSEVWPNRTNNSNLVLKLAECIKKKHDVELLSVSSHVLNGKSLSLGSTAVTIHSIADYDLSLSARLRCKLNNVLFDCKGYGDAAIANKLVVCSNKLNSSFSFDAVLSISEPYAAAAALIHVPKNIPCVVYMMDPTVYLNNHNDRVKYRVNTLNKIIKRVRAVITTPFICGSLNALGYAHDNETIIPVGFPLIHSNNAVDQQKSSNSIRLLFCGWLYSDIRSPKYFLDIVSRLDERFEVTFMGKECELLQERFPIQTKAKLVTLPNQPYETALQAMADADIMINIGNSVPVHMPSKTLEYINTGKPLVNFHKMHDCPTLYYTKRYPLCLNLSENDPDVDSAAERFIDFCIANKGKTVDREYIEREYEDCTPEYIAQKILDALGE